MSRKKGNEAEELACAYLQDNGYSIVERNFYSRFGEIDIIAFREDVYHFVEVKSGEDYEKAIQNITPQKLSRIVKTVHVYMKKHALENAFMLDALIVTPASIDIVQNITL